MGGEGVKRNGGVGEEGNGSGWGWERRGVREERETLLFQNSVRNLENKYCEKRLTMLFTAFQNMSDYQHKNQDKVANNSHQQGILMTTFGSFRAKHLWKKGLRIFKVNSQVPHRIQC